MFLVVLLAGGLVVGAYFMLPKYLESELEKQTGFLADFGEINTEWTECAVEIENASIKNPVSYPDSDFIDINRLKVDLRPMTLWGDRTIIQELIIDIRQLGFITDSEKENNIAAFIKALDEAELAAERDSVEEESEEPVQFLIEHLVFKVDTIKVANYSGQSPRVRNFDDGIQLEMRDVTDVNELVRPLLAELSKQGLVFIAKDVVQSLSGAEGYKGLLQGTVEAIEGSVKGILNGADETGQAMKKIIEKLLKK